MKKTPKRKSVLGRGLSALLDDSPITIKPIAAATTPVKSLHEISVAQIEVNPFQPRTSFDHEAMQELAQSITVHGIIQPVTVRKVGKDKYQLIAGERRIQASKLANIKAIPAFIREANDQQMLEMSLIENIQREDLNAIEIALSYQRLLSECKIKQEELGHRVGKNRTTVTNYLRLLKLPPDIQIGIRDSKISMGHARALINVENIEDKLAIYKKIVKNDLSVRVVEYLVRNLSSKRSETTTKSKITSSEIDPEINMLQKQLSSHFGTKVSIKTGTQNKGEIKIPFISVDDLNRILDILNFH